MHQVEIEVFKSQITQRLIKPLLNLVGLMTASTLRQLCYEMGRYAIGHGIRTDRSRALM